MLYNDDDDADSDELGVRKSGFKFCEFHGFSGLCFFWMDTCEKLLLIKGPKQRLQIFEKHVFNLTKN